MNDKFKVYKYDKYIKRVIAVCFIPWIVPVVDLLTRESNEPINYWCYIFPFVFIAIGVLLLHYSRSIMLGSLIATECDWHTVYELDKRPNNKIHNLKILMNMHLVDGSFEKVIESADSILATSSKISDIYTATHQKILALFFKTDRENYYDEILSLINEQRLLFNNHKVKESEILNSYYDFIEDYNLGRYEESINCIKNLLNCKGIELMNNRKLLVNYLMRLSYLKLNDEKNVEICSNEISLADKNRITFFSAD